jgi:uncharacterized membrane protein
MYLEMLIIKIEKQQKIYHVTDDWLANKFCILASGPLAIAWQ